MDRYKKYIPTEAEEQVTLFQWAEIYSNKWPELKLMFHIPNGGSRNVIEAHSLRLQGVKPGIPDICLPVAKSGYNGLYVELKRKVGGRVSEEQEKMIESLKVQGYFVEVCKGWEEAAKMIEKYLEGKA